MLAVIDRAFNQSNNNLQSSTSVNFFAYELFAMAIYNLIFRES